MKLSVSTLGCPQWDFSQILTNCRSYGYDAIELRGIRDQMDLTRSPLFDTPQALALTKAAFAGAGLAVSAVDTSAMLASARHVEKSRSEAMAAIDLAAAVDARYIRVFGGDATDDETQETATDRLVDELGRLGCYAATRNVLVLLENHDAYSTGEQVADILGRVGHASVGALWDVFNSAAIGEDPATSLASMLPYLHFVHVKDGHFDTGRYRLLGEGEVPIAAYIDELGARGYQGYVSVEWEKRWHPDLDEPEVVFPQYAQVLRTLIGRTSGSALASMP